MSEILQKCQNYKLCQETIPIWMGDGWRKGKETLKEYSDHECPIYLETKLCFEQPKCEHSICADCFRIIYFGEIPNKIIEQKIGKELEHPYQDILDNFDTLQLDYCDLEDYEKYSLTEEWNKLSDIYYKSKEILIENLCTMKCCLCRISNENLIIYVFLSFLLKFE